MTIRDIEQQEKKDLENARRFELLGLMAHQMSDSALTGDGMLSPDEILEEGHALFI
jgi:hypothetical protein